ncbi:nitrate- and nitrite sensing domain-containing protein [Planotetraspora sp. A-T 1434]|uniref:nitrate- and nitrite sensing domain-containing protein n=1 Tax=Planotetraspora sp. A-T 1434 TaxID=2979219 RepID=UPI0021C0F8A9|nr:nitrate- and nitrite sensing domain-containing protein [Planotetraspora sp. A-T 1434]MCT9934848.1 nitrate- and nitrite sensing domain-containing protein [Planotetraspora sp. A-T 1434]
MGSRNRSIRFKIFLLLLLPLLMLSALWGFVLNLTVGDGLALLRAKKLYDTVGVTSTDLGLQLQAERALTAEVLGGKKSASALTSQQARTAGAAGRFSQAARDEMDKGSISADLKVPLGALLTSLERLPNIRDSVALGKYNRLQAINAYNGLMDQLFAVYERLVSVPDLGVFQQGAAMQAMGNAYEMIAREDALICGVAPGRSLTHDERDAFAAWVANQRFLYRKYRPVLKGGMRQPYEEVLSSPVFERFAALENRVIQQQTVGGVAPENEEMWEDAVGPVERQLDLARVKASDALNASSISVAGGIMTRIAIAGGLGLVAIIATIVFSVRFGRRLVGDLADLRHAALDLADVRLPRVVEKLSRGEEVDVDAEAPPVRGGGSSEVEDVAHAFSTVRRTAVEAAVGQANLRRGVNQVFLNLARRKQSLLHRQLVLLDAMQRRSTDPEGLEDLFRLDHLTTRMRRHAEGLIILSGATPGRSWRKPVPIIDVVRAAISEVEDYTRISMLPMPNASLAGASVADIVHLIAELVENATIFSPPQTKVQVRGDLAANGLVLEIEDRGLGLTHEEYAEINERLANPPEFDLADSDRLGLFVVGQLAARYGVRVVLRNSPYGGTTAIVLVPRSLVAEDGSPQAITGSSVRGAHAKHALTGPATTERRGERETTAPSWPEPSRRETAALETAAPETTAPETTALGTRDPKVKDLEPQKSETQDSDAQGSEAQGSEAQGSEAQGSEAQGSEAQGSEAQGSEAQGPDTSPFFTPAALRADTTGAASHDEQSPASAPDAAWPASPYAEPSAASTGSGTSLPSRSRSFPRPSTSVRSPSASTPPNGATSNGFGSRGSGSNGSASNGSASNGSGSDGAGSNGSGSRNSGSHGSGSHGSGAQPSRARGLASNGTHAGLPRRVRQANIAPQLRERSQPSQVPVTTPEERSPEEARAMFSAFQQGARRGREESEPQGHREPGDHSYNTHGEKGDA